jgi:hypothetical protein
MTKYPRLARVQWLTHVIPEADIRKIEFEGQPAQTNCSRETLSEKYPTQKRSGTVAQVIV